MPFIPHNLDSQSSIGAGVTKIVYAIEVDGVSMIAKRCRSATTKDSRYCQFKLLKEVEIFKALELQYAPMSMHVYATCMFGENGEPHEFGQGIAVMYEDGQVLKDSPTAPAHH